MSQPQKTASFFQGNTCGRELCRRQYSPNTLPMNEDANLPEGEQLYPDAISAMGLGLFIWGMFLSYWMLFEAF